MRQHAADATCNCYPPCEPKDGFLNWVGSVFIATAVFPAAVYLAWWALAAAFTS